MELLQLSDQLHHHSKLLLLSTATQRELEQLCRDTPALVSAVQTEQLGGSCQLETILHQQHLLDGGHVYTHAREYGHLFCPVLGHVVNLGNGEVLHVLC